MTGRTDTFDERDSAPTARLLLVAALGLALASTAVLVFSDSLKWMRLGVVAALWAALAGAFLAARYRRQAGDRAERAADLQHVYELELEREVAARREFELETAAEAERAAQEKAGTDLAELREELKAMREHLQQLLGGGEVLVERFALHAEATRMRGVAEENRGSKPLRRITAAGDASTEMMGRVGKPPVERPDGWFEGDRMDPDWQPSWDSDEQPAVVSGQGSRPVTARRRTVPETARQQPAAEPPRRPTTRQAPPNRTESRPRADAFPPVANPGGGRPLRTDEAERLREPDPRRTPGAHPTRQGAAFPAEQESSRPVGQDTRRAQPGSPEQDQRRPQQSGAFPSQPENARGEPAPGTPPTPDPRRQQAPPDPEAPRRDGAPRRQQAPIDSDSARREPPTSAFPAQDPRRQQATSAHPESARPDQRRQTAAAFPTEPHPDQPRRAPDPTRAAPDQPPATRRPAPADFPADPGRRHPAEQAPGSHPPPDPRRQAAGSGRYTPSGTFLPVERRPEESVDAAGRRRAPTGTFPAV
ncbi:DUF6779 domain-containing protein, partial [Actinokineospora spheciospongiae]|uniref:DUF6779 domain-containing protein n=1 Tax=Actinokineospora spheciospongiae TaxID=909613 RepID=UPI00068AEFF3